MTPKQLQKARKKAVLSQQGLADALNNGLLKGILNPISGDAIGAMERGINPIQPYIITFFKNK